MNYYIELCVLFISSLFLDPNSQISSSLSSMHHPFNEMLLADVFQELCAKNSTERLNSNSLKQFTLITDDEHLESKNFFTKQLDVVVPIQDETSESVAVNSPLLIIEVSFEQMVAHAAVLNRIVNNQTTILVLDDGIRSFSEALESHFRCTNEMQEMIESYISSGVRVLLQNVADVSLSNFKLDDKLVYLKNMAFHLTLTNPVYNGQGKIKNLEQVHNLLVKDVTVDFVDSLDLDSYPEESLEIKLKSSEKNRVIKDIYYKRDMGHLGLRDITGAENIDLPNIATIGFHFLDAGDTSIMQNVNAPDVQLLWLYTTDPVLQISNFNTNEKIETVNIKNKVPLKIEAEEFTDIAFLENCSRLELENSFTALLLINQEVSFRNIKSLRLKLDEYLPDLNNYTHETLSSLSIDISESYSGPLPSFNFPGLKELFVVNFSDNFEFVDSLEGKYQTVESLTVINHSNSIKIPWSMDNILTFFPQLENVNLGEYGDVRLRSECPPNACTSEAR